MEKWFGFGGRTIRTLEREQTGCQTVILLARDTDSFPGSNCRKPSPMTRKLSLKAQEDGLSRYQVRMVGSG